MNILVTGAKGFTGKNLVENLKNIRDGKNRTRPNIKIDEIFEFDIDTDKSLLDEYCAKADFVFNLAGVNRPKDNSEFMTGNFGFASELLDTLKKHGNKCPVMLSSSLQATLIGRYDGEYGRSKLAGENLFFDYAKETGATVYVYRFPNLFGKWCRPNYNSAVATFCNNIANDLPIQVNDRGTQLELLYIDDLIEEGYSKEDARRVAATIVAVPGTSEHHTGLAMDVVTPSYQRLNSGYANTDAAKWLKANAAKYGFILRYPEDKTEITKIIFEPWHYRYVGVEYASFIMSEGICFEEFIELYGETEQ